MLGFVAGVVRAKVFCFILYWICESFEFRLSGVFDL